MVWLITAARSEGEERDTEVEIVLRNDAMDSDTPAVEELRNGAKEAARVIFSFADPEFVEVLVDQLTRAVFERRLGLAEAILDDDVAREAAEAYRRYYKSAVARPFDKEEVLNAYNAWLATHATLSPAQKQVIGFWYTSVRDEEFQESLPLKLDSS